jgi:hypothetical protein
MQYFGILPEYLHRYTGEHSKRVAHDVRQLMMVTSSVVREQLGQAALVGAGKVTGPAWPTDLRSRHSGLTIREVLIQQNHSINDTLTTFRMHYTAFSSLLAAYKGLVLTALCTACIYVSPSFFNCHEPSF